MAGGLTSLSSEKALLSVTLSSRVDKEMPQPSQTRLLRLTDVLGLGAAYWAQKVIVQLPAGSLSPVLSAGWWACCGSRATTR